ncbi:hypothetical protein BU15DRAFT_71055 [Melanogaster broomeanus]|nr:hypothetical protein BU15DRAFT_71055 [Melanogaster broomeanus]
MDNPWATSAEPPGHYSEKQSQSPTWQSESHPTHDQEVDIGLPSWSADNTIRWSEPTLADGALWRPSVDDADAWAPSTDEQTTVCRDRTPEQDIADEEEMATAPTSPSSPEPHSVTETPFSADHEEASSTPPPQDSFDAVPETNDGIPCPLAPTEDDGPDARADSTILAAPDEEWGTAWTTVASSESKREVEQPPDEWETARQEKEKLNRAVPPELLASMLRHCQQVSDEIWPARQDPETSGDEIWRTGFDGLEDIAKLLEQLIPDDLSLPPPVRFPATATAKSMHEALKLTRHMPLSTISPLITDVVPDAAPVGWRVLEKGDRINSTEESKSKKAAGGLLSFWNRRASSIPAAAAETTSERPGSPTRSSIDSAKPGASPQPSRAVSPSKPPSGSTTVGPPPPPTSSAQPNSLTLSSDDLEFLSDIVPRASDRDNDHDDEGDLKAFSSVNSSPQLTKLPPLLPPPPKSSMSSRCEDTTEHFNPHVASGSNGSGHIINTPKVPNKLSAQLEVTLPFHTPASPKSSDVSQHPASPSTAAAFIPTDPPSERRALHSDPYAFIGVYDVAYQPFPPVAISSFNPNPPLRSPSPPSHRTYERKHYPTSSSASSILSPVSQDSGDQLRSARSSISASFDDFVSPSTGGSGIRTPSPPPLPAKPQLQRQHPHPIDTFTSRSPHNHHAHTPSQTHASPSVHTGLMNSSFSSPLVSYADHRRTQGLVDHAAARAGLMWPNSPVTPEEPRARAIPPPPSSLAPPTSLIGEEGADLLGDAEVFGSGMKISSPSGPASAPAWGVGKTTFIRPGVAGGPGTGAGTMGQLSFSPPPLPSTSSPLLSLGTTTSVPLAKSHPVKPMQTGGLSEQDLTFFEGL